MSILEKKRDSVKRLIFSSEGISRKGIADGLGLDVRTVSGYIDDLEARGGIRRGLVRPSGKGRPTLLYHPDFSSLAHMGVHLSIGGISCVVCDYDGEPLKGLGCEIEVKAESKLSVISKIITSVKELKKKTEKRLILGGIGVACSRWLKSPLAEYDIFAEITGLLEKQTGVPVFKEMPINAFLYNLRFFENKISNALLLHPGNVLEVGVMIDGEVPFDSQAYEKEFQHTSSNPRGPLCYCGKRGCVDNYATSVAIVDAFRESYGETLTYSDICRKAERGVPEAVKILKDSGTQLGTAAGKFARKHGIEHVRILSDNLIFEHAEKSLKKNAGKKIIFEKYSLERNVARSAANMATYKTVKRFI